MVPENIVEVVQKLRQAINHHDHLYFVLDTPEITDVQYDRMFKGLVELEQKYPELQDANSPTQRVGAPPADGFEKFVRSEKMYSMDKAFSLEEIVRWKRRTINSLGLKYYPAYFVDVKLDGLAVELIYQDGQLVTAATRGDGLTGENVTTNARTIRNLPLTIPFEGSLTVRGEVVMMKEDFINLNKQRVESGKEPWVNPRNAAAGGLKNLDAHKTARRRLRFFAYSIVGTESTITDMYSFLRDNGFQTVADIASASTVDSTATLREKIESIESARPYLPCDIDGAVIRIDDPAYRKVLGFSSSTPKWAIAYKFEAEQATTDLIKIDIQVGRTGVLTPVARLNPVFVGGATVSNATLHNAEEIWRKDVRAGDTVIVRRAGDVIPEIMGHVSRPEWAVPFEYPKTCPVCGGTVEPDGKKMVRCSNINCPAQLKARICHLVSRDAFDINGFGPKLAEQLVTQGIVKSIADIFTLTPSELAKVDRMGEKSINKLLDEIHNKKRVPLARYLYGLGIPHLGRTVSEQLAARFKTLDNIKVVEPVDLLSIPEIGPEITAAVGKITHDPVYIALIETLGFAGVTIDEPAEFSAEGGFSKAAGKKFVITGTLSAPRETIKNWIKAGGGSVVGSISGKTDYLVCGEKVGSKFNKAMDLGIECITEDELMDLIMERP